MRTLALPAVSYAVAAAAAVVLAACKGSTEPVRVPTAVTIEPVGSALTSIGQQVSLRARLFDQFGDSLTGTFIWTSSAPGVVGVASTGTTTATVTSISNGTAIITATSGTASGSTAFTVQQTPTQIVIIGGNGQGGTPGQVLPAPLVARVNDGLGAPVPGAVVAFSVLAGGGSVSQATDTTDANGQASVTWTMGTDEGRVRAAVQGTGIGVEFVATINDETRFNISLRNTGAPLSGLVQLAFDEAKTRWQELIVGDLTAVQLNIESGRCGSASPAINETVDDVVILVTIESIDGPGGVLGSAGPCFIRSTSRLTILGRMRFDQDDMDNLVTAGRLNDVILHEMGHVLGFGTLWTQPQFSCLQNPSSAGPPVSSFDTHFSCANAVARFPEVGGSTYTGGQPVPVENCAGLSGCGAGSINGHWRELAFDNELMTGFLDAGVANPLSVVTVAAMADIGYLVNYGAASEYFHVFTAPGRPRERISLGDDVDRLPIYIYDERRGRIVGVHRP